jgi:hypothetical protein
MTFEVLCYEKRTYRPNEFGKRDTNGTPFITKPTGKACPSLLFDIFTVKPFFDDVFCHKARRKIPVHLGQGAGARTFPAFNAMEDLELLYKFG